MAALAYEAYAETPWPVPISPLERPRQSRFVNGLRGTRRSDSLASLLNGAIARKLCAPERAQNIHDLLVSQKQLQQYWIKSEDSGRYNWISSPFDNARLIQYLLDETFPLLPVQLPPTPLESLNRVDDLLDQGYALLGKFYIKDVLMIRPNIPSLGNAVTIIDAMDARHFITNTLEDTVSALLKQNGQITVL